MSEVTLKEFITQTLTDIYEGAKAAGNYISGTESVEFRVKVVETTSKEGGVKVYVMNASGGTNQVGSTEVSFRLPLVKQEMIDKNTRDAMEHNSHLDDWNLI